MTRLIALVAVLLATPALAASSVAPKLNARIGSPEKPYTSAGAYKWWDTSKADGSGTVMDHVTVTATQRGVNIEKPINGLTIRDSEFIGQKPMANSQFPAGVFAKQGSNLLVERTTIRDWKTIADSNYRQGDCFLAEWGFVGIVLRDVTLSGCTDGGFDSKAREVLLDRVVAEDNKISYRIWYTGIKATTITSINPKEAHFQLNWRKDKKYGMGPGGVTAQKIVFRSTGKQPLFSLSPGSIVNVPECDTQVAEGTRVIAYREGGKASNVFVTLGKSCQPDAQGYAVNTPVADDNTYVTYPTNADSDDDGFVVASGRVAVFGKKGTRWQFDAKTSEGYRYKLVK